MYHTVRLGIRDGLGSNMRTVQPLLLLSALALLAAAVHARAAAPADGVALAIVYDTSGSMKETVPDQGGKPAPKYEIANRALVGIAGQIRAFSTNNAGEARRIDVGLFTFRGDQAQEALRMGRFDYDGLTRWASSFSAPKGNTPLGNTLSAACRAVLQSPLSRKHILVITDGLNTAGPPPAKVLPQLKDQAGRQNATFAVHFVAFDIDAQQFAGVKKLGATVVGASNERQLNSQLAVIMQREILLEDE